MSSSQPIRLIIAGGGTGGHVLPAVAVLQELEGRGVPIEPLWIGSETGTEKIRADELGVPFSAIATGKLRRYLDLKTVKDTANVPRGVWQARGLVRGFRPDVVLSTGGYVSVPTVIGARGSAPVLTHEQTTILGMATKINMRSAQVLALSFESTRALVKTSRLRTVVTGNPVRSSLFNGAATEGRDRYGFNDRDPIVLVMGGALGAQPINQRVQAMLAGLLGEAQVIHQAGPDSYNGDLSRLQAYRETLPEQLRSRYVVTEFIGIELPDVYAMADLLVCRSGAGTVAEIAALGKASILIPLPLSGGGEQVTNARALAGKDAAHMIPQDDATPAALLEVIRSLLANPGERKRMSEAAAALGKRDAGARLTDELLSLAQSRRR
jgi:UDP-N-acetylglucosamine--N-acetylmuramyl-(pentapeptide) pyrophosphoryl-undecaprenol N-acetylglucosamine transferase